VTFLDHSLLTKLIFNQFLLTTDPDQEYINFIRSEKLPCISYILFNEFSIPFSSTSNSENKIRREVKELERNGFCCRTPNNWHYYPHTHIHTHKDLQLVYLYVLVAIWL